MYVCGEVAIRCYCHGYKDMLVGEVAWLLQGYPPFFVSKSLKKSQKQNEAESR